MRKIVFNFAALTVLNLLAKTESIITRMTGNPNFPTPMPSLNTIEAMAGDLNNVQLQMDAGNYTVKEVRDSYRAALVVLLTQLGIYVEGVCAGDPVKLATSGFTLAKTPENVGVLPAPTGLDAYLTGVSGQVDLKWLPVPKSTCYLIEATVQNPASPESTWTVLGVSTRARYTCTGLTPASYYSFRVTAIGRGTGNNSVPSEAASTIVG